MRPQNFEWRLRQLVVPMNPALRLELERAAADEHRTLASLTRHIMANWLRDRELRRQPQAVPAE